MKRRYRRLKFITGGIFRNIRIFYFLNGLAVGILFYFYSEDAYEHQLFKALAANVSQKLPADHVAAEDSILVRSLALTHYLEKNRESVFGDFQLHGFKAEYLQPVTFDLMTGKGACGSNAYVLGRLLMEFGYPIRFAQMKVNNLYGGHIILEVFVKGRWQVLDAFYNLRFKNKEGNGVGFSEVKNNWNYYQSQLPKGYNPTYDFEGVRYTNWEKIPVLMPALYKIISFINGKEFADTVSLRAIILRKFHFLFITSLVLFILLHLIRFYIYRREIKEGAKISWANFKANMLDH